MCVWHTQANIYGGINHVCVFNIYMYIVQLFCRCVCRRTETVGSIAFLSLRRTVCVLRKGSVQRNESTHKQMKIEEECKQAIEQEEILRRREKGQHYESRRQLQGSRSLW